MNVLTKDERIQSVNNIRTYSREFLLNLQFTPFTIRKPVFITEENGVVFDVLVHDPEAEYHKSSRTTEFSDDDDESEYMMDTSNNNSRADTPPFRHRGRRPRGHRGGHVRGSVTANENGEPMYNIPIYQDGKEISRETPSNDRPPRGRGRGRGRNINSSERGKHQRHRSNSRQRIGSQDFQNNVDHFSERRRNSSSNILETSETDNLPASDTEKKRHGRIFGYKLLKELSESDRSPDLLAFELLDTRGGFEELLNKEEMNPDWVILLLQILARIIGTQQKQTLIDLLNVLLTKRFLESQLIPLLNKISMNSVNVTDVSSFVHNAFTICKTALERLPEEFLPPCNLVLVLLQTIVQKNKDSDQTTSYTLAEDVHELELLLKAVGTGIEERKKAIENEAANRRQRHLVCEDLPPPDNFRELAILPAFGDLDFNQRPFLRVNKTEGSYDNLDHYLDVQFRLLREDYIQPLRKGILQYRVEKEHGKVKKFQDIRLYEKVHIVRSACSNDGILHVLQFDVSKMTKVRWESSKRLLYGSLVCLSPDDFETMYFATVTNRDTKELTNGFIQVRFQQNLEELREIGPTENFIMAETTAYFEAYRHTLRGLQQIDSSMPFQTYIVECQSTMKPPKYLLQHGKIIQYDFEPLVNGTKEFNCPVINTRRWPTASEMNLDESQYRALQLAVTKELAIIQGPPGTGKTHIGLKIAELLLHNTSVWNETKEINPILIVCYTNHALDQFLEGILQFCTSVVRIGGRCNSAKLEPYKLSQFRMSARRSLPKKVTLTIQKRKSDCKRQMSKERDKIEETNTKLYTTRFGIMHESILKNYIQKNHYLSLCSGPNGETDIIQWLGIESNSKIGFSEFNEDITANDPLLSTWKRTILNYGNEMKLKEVLTINDVWGLPLENRVRLYKYITTLVRRRLENDILEARNKNRRSHVRYDSLQQDIQTLNRNLEYIESNILSENQLLTYIPDNFKPIVMQMKTKKPPTLFSRTNQTVVEQWLCLDGTEESRQSIKNTMKELDDDEFIDVDEEATIVEQERKIEDDDDDFLYNEKRKNISSHVELDDLAMVAFDTTSSSADDKEEGDWITVKSKEKQKKLIRKILFGNGTFSDDEIAKIENIWELSFDEKAKLYRSWLSKYQIELKISIEDCERRYVDVCQSYREAMDMEDAELIRNTKVVAMTTTGAAKFRVILQTIKPKIIIVEEAAEVLESHIITALNENCQHLILIGDHKQLRPSPTVYELATKYKLEISLFERMIKNEINYVTLEQQHRMRPEISILMKHIYSELKDHPSVLRRANILGLDDNIFFITHQQPEQHSEETKSRSNIHEAKYAVELCKYFMNQGYTPQQITILAAYSGQIFQLRKLMPKATFNGVRVTVVDNFQGEENDIIILSLVRSNNDNSIGFLSIENRVCVALSRARRGFYIIGNIDLLSYNSSLWANIESTLKERQAIGPKLRLRCQNHREKVTEVTKAEDFSHCRGGGCDKFCGARLKCGHACKKTCHIADNDHILYKCAEICGKTTCPAGHTCKKKCFQECGLCSEPVQKIHPVCGHRQIMPCHTDPHLFNCQDVCRWRLPCGHDCQGVCGTCSKENKHNLCKTLCRRKLLCGHMEDIDCSIAVEKYKCSQKCEYTLDCGHKCKGTCGDCFEGTFHVPCQEKCKTTLICGHLCNQNCGKPCQTCVKDCQVSCQHSKCKEKCGFPCTDCKEKCGYSCEHDKCSKLCGELCDRIPCKYKCQETLPCKHKCMGLCGEPCPSVCLLCDASKAKKIYPYCTKNTTFVVLEDCRHIFESTSMDDWIFERDIGKGVFIEMLRCPQCNKPITNSKRYGRFINSIKENVDKIKSNLIVTNKSIFIRKKVEITTRLQKGKRLDQTFIDRVLLCLEDQTSLTMEVFDCLENQIVFLSCLGEMTEILDQNTKLSLQQPFEVKEIRLSIDRIKGWVLLMRVKPNKTSGFKSIPRKHFTVIELHEISYEILRIDFIVQFLLLLQHGTGTSWMNSATKGDILESLQNIVDTKKCSDSDRRLWTHKLRRLLKEAGSLKTPRFKIPTNVQVVASRTFVARKWCKCRCGHIYNLPHPSDKPCAINCQDCKDKVDITSINDVPFITKKTSEAEFEETSSPVQENKEFVEKKLNWKTVTQPSENTRANENMSSKWKSVDYKVDHGKIENLYMDGKKYDSKEDELQSRNTNESSRQTFKWETVQKDIVTETTKPEMSNVSLNIKEKQRWISVGQTSMDEMKQGKDTIYGENVVIAGTDTPPIKLTERTENTERTKNRWITINQKDDKILPRKTREMTTAEYENAFTLKSNKDVRPKMPLKETSDTYLRQSSIRDECVSNQHGEVKNEETSKQQTTVKSFSRQLNDGDVKPKTFEKSQRYIDSFHSNVENLGNSCGGLTKKTNTDAHISNGLAKCIEGHVYTYKESSYCPDFNMSVQKTRSAEPSENFYNYTSTLPVKDMASKEKPDIVQRMEVHKQSSGVFKCRNGHVFAMNPKFAKELNFCCPDCGNELYPKEILEQIQQTKYSSSETVKSEQRRLSDVNNTDKLKYEQTSNLSSQSKERIVDLRTRYQKYQYSECVSAKNEIGEYVSSKKEIDECVSAKTEIGECISSKNEICEIIPETKYSKSVQSSGKGSLITEGVKFFEKVLPTFLTESKAEIDKTADLKNWKERSVVLQERLDVKSDCNVLEKGESDKKRVVYMWFRCSKGHLYNREQGDPDQDVCTKCGEKEGKSLI